ncbi:MAG: SxtJ family membrane protein [Bacteroidia bacterium]|nr:SxtJ family membrane protein [Bacteroidia bacterium]
MKAHHQISEKQVYQTILVLSTAAMLAFMILKKNVFLYLALSFCLLGLVYYKGAYIFTKCWFKFSEILGKVSSFILLGIIFYLVLTPVAFIFKMKKKNYLNLKKLSEDRGIYISVNKAFSREDFEKKW